MGSAGRGLGYALPMIRFIAALAAVFGFVFAATLSYLVFVEYLHWDTGVIKIAAPLSIGGAIAGWEIVEKGFGLLGFGAAKPPSTS